MPLMQDVWVKVRIISPNGRLLMTILKNIWDFLFKLFGFSSGFILFLWVLH